MCEKKEIRFRRNCLISFGLKIITFEVIIFFWNPCKQKYTFWTREIVLYDNYQHLFIYLTETYVVCVWTEKMQEKSIN